MTLLFAVLLLCIAVVLVLAARHFVHQPLSPTDLLCARIDADQ